MSSSSESSSLILVSDDEVDDVAFGFGGGGVLVLALVVVVFWFWLCNMGAAESKPEEEGTNNNQDRYYDPEREGGSNKNESSSSCTVFAVGAAVGTALLGVAWSVSRYRSKDFDERVDNHYFHAESFKTIPVANSYSQEQKSTLKILSYNVCSREDYPIHERMKAIGDLVQLHTPHFICFQEITPAIFNIFQGSSWWNDYYCSMSTEEASNKQYFCILVNFGLILHLKIRVLSTIVRAV
ncbi:endonuclease/exonuclease/phosphatase family protein [Thalictrum thalictroides]|uniref:Endonuclease/exonuclease/phosphatase family protein n=1 Tax=Thalictrum thalictroides TaxID=46969 RepID=A0A7J6WRK3_THATH|nr:endonuclease/exonuclease/phosphatase family protein [Thalictrum thalictroides]